MTSTTTRDDFYSICGAAAALILAVALGVPAVNEASVDARQAARQAPTPEAAELARSAFDPAAQPAAPLLQPSPASARGV